MGEQPMWGTPEGQRIIELLWAPPEQPARGPRPKTSVREIVAAAMALADAEGFDALSMRALAKEVGVGAMTLYSYVPGKAELFELMVDAAYAERPLPEAELDWRERYRRHAFEARQMYRRHPWLLESNLWRLPLGPGVLAVTEDLLAIGQSAGLSYAVGSRVSSLLEAYSFGTARGEIADRDEARRTGQSSDDFWDARASFWQTYFDAARYPTMFATWEAGAYDEGDDPDRELGFAIDLILDSVARLVER
ncbi:TetR/AcrR family transcriptional regulator [Ammonicoccus fulvus]|uniref:TetR/AcrR family transcriptional regulator n=1 Tax=Ammonicoccus fulvus TaxID=3138240 RepID=A0ABZ3FVG2_9ACTN